MQVRTGDVPPLMAEVRPVAVVVLTWNARSSTEACFEQLRGCTDHPAWRLIVVDNGSTDGTVDWLRTTGDLTLIENERNLGYSRGCNLGIGAATADEDVVLLNNDVLVCDPRWLSELQRAAYASSPPAITASRLIDHQGRMAHLGAFVQPVSLRGQQLGGGELDVNQCARNRAVEAVSFAQVYLPRDCIDAVGLLDEELFAYFEDTDYCLRAARAGRPVICAGEMPPSVHAENTSARENDMDFWSVYSRSQSVFRRKWGRWVQDERYEHEIVWKSVLHQPLGYAVQSRRLMHALNSAGIKVAYRNAYGDNEEPTGDLLVDDLVRLQPSTRATQIAFCQADAFPAAGPAVGWTMLEVTGLPSDWVDGCNRMDEVWVPASFNVETFESSGVKVPVRVMPLGVDTDYFNPAIRGYRASDRFTFLSVFDWGERKAPEVLLRTFASEFGPDEDVVLLLSVSNRDPGVDVDAEIARLELPPSAPIVLMVNPGFASYQMGSLYHSADCFVLPTRGEGWGMPVLEAMACGLPVIVTQWSGPADFLHEGVGYPLDVKALIPAQAKCPYYEGFEWADPDIDHLRHLMRHVVDHPDEARKRGQAASTEVASSLTWAHTAQRVKERLSELK